MFEALKRLSLPRPALFARPAPAPERPPAAPPAPRALFFEAADRVARRDRLPFHLAMEKVRRQEQALFEAAFPLDRRPGTSPRTDAPRQERCPELLAA